MPLTVSGSVSSPAAFAAAIKRRSRRQIAAQLRIQGQSAVTIGQNLANQRLGPPRVGARRRDHGVSYHRGFTVEYTGLDEFAEGLMIVSVRNGSKHARVLEHGSGAHTISPSKKTRLAWPPPPYASGEPTIFMGKGQSVRHPGTKAYKILEDTARQAILKGMAGRVIGHININIRMGRPR